MKHNANNQHQKRLELFAHLANIEDLGLLKDWEKLQLVDEMREAGFSWISIAPPAKLNPKSKTFWQVPQADGTRLLVECEPKLLQSWGLRDPIPIEWLVLQEGHERCRPKLHDLLDGKEIDPIDLQDPQGIRIRVEAQTGKLQYLFFDNPIQPLRGVFEGILRQEVFPFRRCPVCRMIFVPGKNQKYCTPDCMAKGTVTRRRDERREYMRKYMAKKRAKGKQPVVKFRGNPTRKPEN